MKPWIKYTLIALMVAIMLTILIVIAHKMSVDAKAKKDAAKKKADGNLLTTHPNPIPDATFPLKKGSKGDAVGNLQRWLKWKGEPLPKYGADNDFGKETDEALFRVTGSHEVSESFYSSTILAYISNPLQDSAPVVWDGTVDSDSTDPANTGDYWGNPFTPDGALGWVNPANWYQYAYGTGV